MQIPYWDILADRGRFMRRMMTPSPKTMEVFRNDLWKDQRCLEKTVIHGQNCLIKHYISENEAKHEKAVLKYLSSRLHTAKVPHIIDEGSTHAVLPYLNGIRVFNLFVELDRLNPPLDVIGREIKKTILLRCEENQKEIQSALVKWGKEACLLPYPKTKLITLINVLSDCLGIDINYSQLDQETDVLWDILTQNSTVPFRDATTKNMVLASPQLWLGEFKGEEERRLFLSKSLSSISQPDWLNAAIYDYDFASCTHCTTPEDDVISLKYHERSWSGMPVSAKDLTWFGDPDPKRAAVTFLARYYRFGGRKAAYRLLHPSGHRIRFRHDDDVFYFDRITSIMNNLWPGVEDVFPHLLEFTRIVAKSLRVTISTFDYFRADKTSTIKQKPYYVDMFPE